MQSGSRVIHHFQFIESQLVLLWHSTRKILSKKAESSNARAYQCQIIIRLFQSFTYCRPGYLLHGEVVVLKQHYFSIFVKYLMALEKV